MSFSSGWPLFLPNLNANDFKYAVRLAIEVCFDVKTELRKAPTDVLPKN